MRAHQTYRRLIQGDLRGPIGSLGRLGLALAALPYCAVVAARNFAYDRGWCPTMRAECPVVSLGNITLGGTGKTPMVEWVCRWFRRRGVRVAILSRGYGARGGLNDEGRALDLNLPDVPHLQHRDRVALARVAFDELESQVLVLDDGFQHRRLARDLDIVLLDALDPFGAGRMFPRGLLREPPGVLRRAKVVVLSRADLIDASRRAAIRAEAERHASRLAWAEARHAPRDCVDWQGIPERIETLQSRRIAAFCGIGNPEGFRKTLEGMRVQVAAFRAYPDHHVYTRAEVDNLHSWVRSQAADLALTTQKDLVKLCLPTLGGAHLRALRIGLEFMSGEALVEELLAALSIDRDTPSSPDRVEESPGAQSANRLE
jgi:tetraacyldisaccharide 4'-kinase